jgi:hypothetical protein
MRVGLIISVIIHVAVFLWIMVAPAEMPFDPARADPVLVDLVSAKDVPLAEPAGEPAKSEMANPAVPALELPTAALKTAPVKPAPFKATPRSAEAPKPEPPKPEHPKPEHPKPEPPKPVREADLKPTPKPAPAPMTAAAPSVEDQAAAASRFAWMLDWPTASLTNAGGGLPSESGSKLTSNEVAKFRARVSQCWVAPADVPAAPGFNVLIRVALKPNGALGADPALVLAPASMSGPLLVESAKRALQQCQPYDFLPADKYQDWKILELGFSVDGPSDDFRTPALDGTSVR